MTVVHRKVKSFLLVQHCSGSQIVAALLQTLDFLFSLVFFSYLDKMKDNSKTLADLLSRPVTKETGGLTTRLPVSEHL